MKYKSLIMVLLLAFSVFAVANVDANTSTQANGEINESGAGISGKTSAEINADANNEEQNGEDIGLQIKSEIQSKIQNKLQAMEQKQENASGNEKKVLQTRNKVRETVHYFLAFSEELGNETLGQKVSSVAQQFNNSVEAQTKAEVQLENRGQFMKFLFGSDETALAKMQEEKEQIETKINEMQEIKAELNVEQKAFVESQIEVLQEDQERIGLKVQQEMQNKGILGWMFK